MLNRKVIAAALLSTLFSAVAQADDITDRAQALVNTKILALLSAPEIVDSVNAQNEMNKALSQEEIDKLDKEWRAETKNGGGALVDKTLSAPVSDYLKKVKEKEKGLFTEIFIMDNHGLNVGQSDITSDYWQGDEAKWQKTYLVGKDAVDVSEVEFDESTQTYQVQVSVTISDKNSGSPIGAATFGVNAEAL